MSIWETLLNNPLVIASIGLAGLFFAAALATAVAPAAGKLLKDMKEQREARRAERQQARAAARSARAADAPSQAAPGEPNRGNTQLIGGGVAVPVAGVGKAAQPEDIVDTAAPEGSEAANTQPEEESSEKEGSQVTSAIQDILDSVFEDEESTARYDALLSGLGDVDVQALAELAAWTHESLRNGMR